MGELTASHPLSADDRSGAMADVLIQVFDPIRMNHPSQAGKRSSDTTADRWSCLDPRRFNAFPHHKHYPKPLKLALTF